MTNAADIRKWANENGYQVGTRGRIKPEIITAYETAHGIVPEQAPAAPAQEPSEAPEQAKYVARPMVTPGVAESFGEQAAAVAKVYAGQADLTDELIEQAKREGAAIVAEPGGKLRVHHGGEILPGVSVLLDWRRNT